MLSAEPRARFEKTQLIEVICQLRFPDILKIESAEPADFQEAIRSEYPVYNKQVGQLPPKILNGNPVQQGTINNYHFISPDSRWKVSLTQNFIALSTHGYTVWEEYAKRLDTVLAAFIKTYEPAYFTRVGLRFINGISKKQLGLEDMQWRDLITPGYLGLMGDDDAQESAFTKNEQSIAMVMAGGCKANLKCGPGVIRKVNNRTRETTEEKAFMLDIDAFMEGNVPMNHTVPALNIIHTHADSLFRGALTETLYEAMEPQIL